MPTPSPLGASTEFLRTEPAAGVVARRRHARRAGLGERRARR